MFRPLPAFEEPAPACGGTVLAKRGAVNVWRWAHANTTDCDVWHEPEPLWHRRWKEAVPEVYREVVIGNHRADIKIDSHIFEFQKSAISKIEVEERNCFYLNNNLDITWVLFAEAMEDRFVTNARGNSTNPYFTFRWKHPRKSFVNGCIKLVLDFCNQSMFIIKKINLYESYEYAMFVKNGEAKGLEQELAAPPSAPAAPQTAIPAPVAKNSASDDWNSVSTPATPPACSVAVSAPGTKNNIKV